MPDAIWSRRHRSIVVLLWLHVPLLAIFGIARGFGVWHSITELLLVASFAIVASIPGFGRATRSASAAIGLVACSALLIHFWDGQIEGHFHFFVVVSLLILYQDWLPFLLAFGFVVLHHGVLGTVVADSVYDHGAATANPWAWALVHGGFIAAASAANIVTWRATEHLLRDPLTGLSGRAIMFDRLRLGLIRARRRGQHAGVIFLDLDRFKLLNDSLGHAVGDRVLVTAGERLHDAVRAGDTAVRFGGDEFVVVCEDLEAPAVAVEITRRLMTALREPYRIGDHEIVLTVSAGIAVSELGDARSAEDLIRDADAAMYHAKESGKDRYVVFGEAMRDRALTRFTDEIELRRAVAGGELCLRYEPQLALLSGRLRAVEAHVYWQHSRRGLLAPRDVLATAEEAGMVVPIGEWAITEACRQLSRWRRSGAAADLTMSLNVSAEQLRDESLVAVIERALRVNELEPTALCLEIPEAAVTADPASAGAALGRLRATGVRLALDGFGTGHLSMSCLRQLRFDTMKLNRVYVRDLDQPGGSAVLRGIVEMAHALGTPVTAKGVATGAQLRALRAIGCDAAQGPLLASPGPADEVGRLVTSPRRAATRKPELVESLSTVT
ncbi:MAG: EAL domain-containing protein [Solirubrobacteraceae bacterium]|nr:EAL domain-containing protein [Solirubrobacteraceae bacterium]